MRLLSSVRVRSLSVVLAAVAPVACLVLYSAVNEHGLAEREAQEDAVRLLRVAVSEQDGLVQASHQLLASMAEAEEVTGGDPRRASALLARVLAHDPMAYANLGLIGPDGMVRASAIPVQGTVDLSDRRYFQLALETKDFSVGEYQIGRITGKPSLNCGYPVLDPSSGQVSGVLYAAIDLGWFGRILRTARLPPDAAITVFDSKGLVLVREPDPGEWVGREIDDAELVEMVLEKRDGIGTSAGLDGVERFYAFRTLRRGDGVYACLGIPTVEAFAEARAALFWRLLALSVAVVIALAAAWVGSEALVLRRYRELAAAAKRMSAGDLSGRVEVAGPAESRVAAAAFNEMAERISQMLLTEESAKSELAARVEGLVALRTRELFLLGQLVEHLQACLSPREATDVARHLLLQIFPDDFGAIYLMNASRNLLERAACWGEAGAVPDVETFPPDDCWALRRGQIHVVEGGAGGLPCPHLPPEAPEACLCMPMMAHGEALGVLHIAMNPGAHLSAAGWGESRARLGDTVAEQLGLALSNLKLRETLRDQSIRDPLTRLFNRRYLEENLERECARSSRSGRPFAIVVIDLDHFKAFNDTFGHEAGDVVLGEFARLLQSSVRGSDLPCRLGGEEFVLLLPEASLEDARGRAEELRESANRLALVHRGQSLGRTTISLGVSAFPEHGRVAAELLRAADAALYRAKAEGRDRVVVAERVEDLGVPEVGTKGPTAASARSLP
ncbi:MAG: diguanylate cyclase [Planctomycetes bacterium]|nr:diguanylate cyclase [Planctomycetota bacterium]